MSGGSTRPRTPHQLAPAALALAGRPYEQAYSPIVLAGTVRLIGHGPVSRLPGFDEGAWITTSFGIGQMLIGVASPHLGAVFGVRRILLLGITLFFTASLLGPLSPNLPAFLTIHFLGGVGSGTFIPLTISFRTSAAHAPSAMRMPIS